MKKAALAFYTLALFFLGTLAGFTCPAGKECRKRGIKIKLVKIKKLYSESDCKPGTFFWLFIK